MTPTLGLLHAVTSISALTLLSRVLGLVRDLLLYHVVGVNWATGSFLLAWMVPNLLRRLFGEGALSAAFIPAFTRIRGDRGDGAARGLLAGVSGALLVTLGTVTVLVLIGSWLVPAEFPGLDGGEGISATERGTLIHQLLRILFPYVVPVCLLAIYAGALNSLGVFAPTAAAPALLNVFWIAGIGVAWMRSPDDPAAAIRTVAWAVAAGGVVQLLLGILPLRRRGMLAAPRLPRPGDGTRKVFVTMAPAALGLSIAQLNLLVDQALAEFLVGPGSNNHIYLANRLLLFPHAMVAIPLATAVFPTLAADALKDPEAARTTLSRAVRYGLLLSLPATAGMIWIVPSLLDTVFVHGRYTGDDAALTTATTMTLVASLPAIGVAQLYSRTLFAVGDTRTPARIAVWLVGLNIALNLLLVLGVGLGVEGFTIATSLCSFINAALLRAAVRQRGLGDRVPLGWILRPLLAVTLMVAALAGFGALTPALDGRAAKIAVDVMLTSVIGIVAFALAAGCLGISELQDLRAALARRRRR